MEELAAIQEQIVKLCSPQKILLFGSRAKEMCIRDRLWSGHVL